MGCPLLRVVAVVGPFPRRRRQQERSGLRERVGAYRPRTVSQHRQGIGSRWESVTYGIRDKYLHAIQTAKSVRFDGSARSRKGDCISKAP